MPRFSLAIALFVVAAGTLHAQEPAAEPPTPPVIADEPKTIDPATLMPEALAAKGTVKFEGQSLLEMAKWFADEHDLKVLFDKRSLDEVGVPLGEPVYDHLDDEPLYLLLGRLKMLDLAWYYEDGLVRVTSQEAAESRGSTVPYNLGDLIDAGYDRDSISDAIISTIDTQSWSENGGGDSDIQWLGDVMFVRQTGESHRRLAGLLTAFRGHGRRTFVFDPPQHITLREKLDQPITLELDQVPLVVAVEQIAAAAKVDLRLDKPALKDAGISEREPVTLDLEERQLRTVLQVALGNFKLTWMLRDGVLWVTSEKRASSLHKTAVYDVRDLCRDESEGEALMAAILSQSPEHWAENGGGDADMRFAKVGTLVVSHNEAGHEELLALLERYRAALRVSKPRAEDKPDPKEVLTRYYRMPTTIAEGLARALPRLVAPESWKSAEQPEGVGTIMELPSEAEVIRSGDKPPLVTPQSVLIVVQTRENHEAIVDRIDKVRHGDRETGVGGLGGAMGGGMGGGFGGGAFSVERE
jgi:hypothetical protein